MTSPHAQDGPFGGVPTGVPMPSPMDVIHHTSGAGADEGVGLFELLLALPALAALILAAWLLAEVAAGAGSVPRRPLGTRLGPLTVLIPAHDEAGEIARTVRAVRAQLREGDRVLVVADNCTDATARLAREAGAETTERTDAERRGKGFALQHGLDVLRADPPQTVVLVDADCTVTEGALDLLAGAAERSGRPVQALYLMDAAAAAGPKGQVSAFAWTLINRTRMTGLSWLADTCRLLGTGMAFPWALAEGFALGTSEIVEDIALACQLTARGAAPVFVPEAVVTSALPATETAATTQRARWEIGSIRLARRAALPLLWRGVRGRDARAAALGLDLLVPPLVLFAGVIGALLAAGLVLALFGATLPLTLAGLAGAAFAGAVALGWHAHGREVLPPDQLGALAAYARTKLRVYGAEGRASARQWTRTGRD